MPRIINTIRTVRCVARVATATLLGAGMLGAQAAGPSPAGVSGGSLYLVHANVVDGVRATVIRDATIVIEGFSTDCETASSVLMNPAVIAGSWYIMASGD